MDADRRQESLRALFDRHVARYATREEDWDVFSFQERIDPKFKRSQRRYIGAGGSGKHNDPNAVPATSFTLTIMMIEPGHGAPLHTHEVEEVFFVLDGEAVFFWERDGERIEAKFGRWDMIYHPPGVQRGVRNDSDKPVYFQVMLGKARPERPSYQDLSMEKAKEEELARS